MDLSKFKKFLDKAKEKHNEKYSYNVDIIPKNVKCKIEIICPIHGSFFATLDNHIHQGTGCPKCAGVVQSNTKQFIERCKDIFINKPYDYSNVEYINAKTSGIIICPIHGEFSQTPYAHIVKKQGCPNCKGGQQQKPYGYWNVKSNCEAVAKECKNKNDFQLKYSSAYRSSLKNKWLDEFCEKYFLYLSCFSKIIIFIE